MIGFKRTLGYTALAAGTLYISYQVWSKWQPKKQPKKPENEQEKPTKIQESKNETKSPPTILVNHEEPKEETSLKVQDTTESDEESEEDNDEQKTQTKDEDDTKGQSGKQSDELQSIPMSMEFCSIADGAPRVKFKANYKGDLSSFFHAKPALGATYRQIINDMADAMWEMESCGVCPVQPDGKVGGNGAALLFDGNKPYMIVTKSGKLANQRMDLKSDFCFIRNFDLNTWECDYMALSTDILPTSDTPMHFSSLHADAAFNWAEKPIAVLHGHALESEEEAQRLGIPCSTEETLCSTPEDTTALMNLMSQFPYPANKLFIRKGHGFIILGSSVQDALNVFRERIKPFLHM